MLWSSDILFTYVQFFSQLIIESGTSGFHIILKTDHSLQTFTQLHKSGRITRCIRAIASEVNQCFQG